MRTEEEVLKDLFSDLRWNMSRVRRALPYTGEESLRDILFQVMLSARLDADFRLTEQEIINAVDKATKEFKEVAVNAYLEKSISG